jgi:integrase
MAAAGVPLRTLQEWMGHRDFKTTHISADHQPSEQEAALVERAFGRQRDRELQQEESGD